MSRNGLWLLVVVLAAGLIGAGCGGDDDGGDGEGDGEVLSTDQFVTRGNEICRNVDTTLNQIERSISGEASSPQEVAQRFADEAVPVITDGINEIGDIEIEDAEVEGRVDEMAQVTEDVGEQFQDDPSAALPRTAQGDNPYKPARDIAVEVGLRDCFPDVD